MHRTVFDTPHALEAVNVPGATQVPAKSAAVLPPTIKVVSHGGITTSVFVHATCLLSPHAFVAVTVFGIKQAAAAAAGLCPFTV